MSEAEAEAEQLKEEHLDVLTNTGQKTGVSKPRGDVHRDGDYHRAVHVWIFAESTQELLLQRRADCKDSWPGLWDISSAGHISAGDSSIISARRELHEELGVFLLNDAFELIFIFLQEWLVDQTPLFYSGIEIVLLKSILTSEIGTVLLLDRTSDNKILTTCNLHPEKT